MGPETKKSAITRDLADAKPETRKLYRASPRSSSFKEFSRKATDIQRKVAKTPVLSVKPPQKVGVQRQSALAKQFGNPMRQGVYDKYMSTVVPTKVKVDEPKALPSGKKALPGTAPIKPVDVKVDPPKKPRALPGTAKPPKRLRKPSSIKLPPARKNAALAAAAKNAPANQKSVQKMVKGALGTVGKGAGRALGAAGSGLDAYMNYRKYRNQGDGKLRAGLKSAFRTSLGWLGGAAGATVGGLAGGVGLVGGGITGYSGGTWLADKVLGATTKKKLGPKKSKEVTIMYYNYTDEEKYFLSVTDAMLKDDYSVEEIVEFWQSEDQDQVEGILGSLTLTESVDYGNPKLAVVCERFGLGTAWGWIRRSAGA